MPDFEKFLKGISQGVKKFYEPITDRVKDANEKRSQKGKPKSIKSNVPGDLDVTYDETLPLKDQFAINPNPFKINEETGKAQVKSDHFTQNSTILDEHVVDSKDPKTSKYNELRNSMPKPPKPPAQEQQLMMKKEFKALPKQKADPHPINKKMENTYTEKFQNPRHDLIEGDKNL
jgi:hypothetical protein